MTLRHLFLVVLTTALSLTVFGCDLLGSDEDEPSVVTDGVYVANQGNFGDGNGSVSLYNPNTDNVTSTAIGGLNSIVQSITLRDDRLYLVANSGGRVDVFDAMDQSQQGQLADLSGPRYLTFADNETAFLTDQSFSDSSSVKVLDVSSASLELATTIDVPGTPEGLTATDDRVYATLGGFSDTTLVAALDADQPSLTETIDVGCAPRYAVADRQDDVFVLCSDTSEAVVLDGATGTEEARLSLPDPPSTLGPGQPAFFAAEAEELYVVVSQDRLTRINTATNEVDATLGPFDGSPIGAVGYDAVREELYVGHVPGFTERGTVTIHERSGTQTDSFRAGIAPTYIDFRRSEE